VKKRCGTCKVEKSVREFGANRSKPDGLQSSCNTCRQTVNAKYYVRSKEKFNPVRLERRRRAVQLAREHLLEYLLGHPCVDCGETDVIVLQFDHQGDKVAEICSMVASGYIWPKIMTEIAKCEVVCANDHARRTARSFGWFKATLASSEAEHSTRNGGVGMSEFPRGTAA
jgi:hypothetical protein